MEIYHDEKMSKNLGDENARQALCDMVVVVVESAINNFRLIKNTLDRGSASVCRESGPRFCNINGISFVSCTTTGGVVTRGASKSKMTFSSINRNGSLNACAVS